MADTPGFPTGGSPPGLETASGIPQSEFEGPAMTDRAKAWIAGHARTFMKFAMAAAQNVAAAVILDALGIPHSAPETVVNYDAIQGLVYEGATAVIQELERFIDARLTGLKLGAPPAQSTAVESVQQAPADSLTAPAPTAVTVGAIQNVLSYVEDIEANQMQVNEGTWRWSYFNPLFLIRDHDPLSFGDSGFTGFDHDESTYIGSLTLASRNAGESTLDWLNRLAGPDHAWGDAAGNGFITTSISSGAGDRDEGEWTLDLCWPWDGWAQVQRVASAGPAVDAHGKVKSSFYRYPAFSDIFVNQEPTIEELASIVAVFGGWDALTITSLSVSARTNGGGITWSTFSPGVFTYSWKNDATGLIWSPVYFAHQIDFDNHYLYTPSSGGDVRSVMSDMGGLHVELP